MRGVVFTGDRTLELAEVPDPTPGPADVVLEMKASGLCGSDLKFYRAPKGMDPASLGLKGGDGPVIAGHEPCGVIAAVGREVPARNWRVGDRVMVHHYKGCDVCPQCRTGWTQMCEEGATVYGITGHGGHAPYMKAPATTLVHLPEELSFSTGAAIACGTGTAFGALVRLGVTARDTVVIVGQGPVGLSATQFAAAMGARVIAVDVSAERARQAAAFGAAETIDASEGDPVEAVRALTAGRGASRTMDASGTAAGRSVAVRAAGRWGVVAMVGEGGDVTIDVSRDILRKQLTIVGSWTFTPVGQADCAQFVARHGIDVDALFSDRWSLAQAEEAYVSFDRQASGKAVFLI
jgi:(R,R)-butanediol dehydrogenase / meso-butanediol dehydrogenase / diacetyl reductase